MDEKISRQRAWQIRMSDEGRCETCGGQPLVTTYHCERCRRKRADRELQRYRERRRAEAAG